MVGRDRISRGWLWEIVPTVVLACAVLLMFWPAIVPVHGDEPRSLFKAVDLGKTDLTEKQSRVLERLKRAKTTAGVSVVTVAHDALNDADAPPLMLNLGADAKMEMRDYKVRSSDSMKKFTWIADLEGRERGDSAHLVSRGRSLTGLVYMGKDVYSVEPIGGGLHAVVRLDQRNFPKDHPPGAEQFLEKKASEVKEGAKKEGAKKPAPKDAGKKAEAKKERRDANEATLELKDAPPAAEAPAGPAILRVLVAYTPKVDDELADVAMTIESAVDLANTSYQNSRVNLRMELAETLPVTYTESATHEEDLARFMGKNDQVMDEVHTHRNQSKADLCVLLIDNPAFCGLAAAIGAEEDSAFAVVHYECAVGNLSFPHEIGHLLGARHNPEVDPTNTPYAHGHCYLCPQGGWRTIMAYPTSDNPTRIPWWSNPNVTYQGKKTGTPQRHDNARVLNTTAPTITGFRK